MRSFPSWDERAEIKMEPFLHLPDSHRIRHLVLALMSVTSG